MAETTAQDELLASLVASSCQASGVPERVEDKATLLDVAAWLRSCDD